MLMYHTGEFAQVAAVTERTLRYYDKVGLLSPSGYTEAGYRLYTNEDLLRLQQILALKFLGFSLAEIKAYLQVDPAILQESLAVQRAMMQERREQLDAIIQAIEETEKALQTGLTDWDSLAHVIQVIQMTQQNDWRKKYLTDEQLKTMEELSKNAYSEEDKTKIAEWGKNWSEEDQARVSQQWDATFAELRRLVAQGADPASPEAQALAQRWSDLVGQFTHGDPGVSRGLRKYYEGFAALPAEQRPFSYPIDEQSMTFIQQALKIYSEKQG
jgi:DNA-binding transcriptional MerR regulator